MTHCVKLLKELIATRSVNPAFLPADDSRSGEARVAEMLVNKGRKAGLDVELQPVAPGRHNVLIRLAPRGRILNRVWLAPHMDTVNAEDSMFSPRVLKGRIFGRGACDTKGSIAVFFSALAALANSRCPSNTEVTLAALVDEEHAQLGSRALASSGLKADLAIVGEPTKGRVVTAHKGNLWIKIETRGKAAHGSRPDLGLNAIRSMSRVVDLLESRYAAALREKLHPLLGCATINVGAIRGGSQPNIVPDRCEIQIDRRTLPGETQEGVLVEIKKLLRSEGVAASISMLRPEECQPMETNPNLELVRLLMRTARQPKPAGVHYFCDASILSSSGVSSVVFGPGDIAQAHTIDEWVEIASLEKSEKILLRFLNSLP